MPKKILFFADRLPPLIGGMERHAGAFIEHFTNHPHFPLIATVTKDQQGDLLLMQGEAKRISLTLLTSCCNPKVVFFNSGKWIEELGQIRKLFPKAMFVYRTGGNEIIKAPLTHTHINDHAMRQAYWKEQLNKTIDLLITNSAYTEKRLRALGITLPFARKMGGVDLAFFNSNSLPKKGPPIIFCAARFVPYKNHATLLKVFSRLMDEGYFCRLRLAGEGPLLKKIKKQVLKQKLEAHVDFLGALTNKATCEEIAQSNLYVQLSVEHQTRVPGGVYLHTEGMGRSILEAITAGTYIVAGRSGALEELVTPERGILVNPHCIEEIIQCIQRLLNHPPKRGKLTEIFSWTHLFKDYESLWGN